MSEPFVIARTAAGADVLFRPSLANRHGLITGATGTGKTVTLQMLAEHFSRIGVPVFVADVKGDLSGVGAAGAMSPRLAERLKAIGIPEPAFAADPVVFWDVFGKRGFPIRATVSDLGPLLLGRLFGLNATQQGVLALVFKIADDNGLLLLDVKDLRAMLAVRGRQRVAVQDRVRQHLGGVDWRDPARGDWRSTSRAATSFFGEPMLNIDDLIQTDAARARHGQRAGRRRADPIAEGLRDIPALDAVGAVRAAARSRRSGQADAGVLLRRGAPAVHRRDRRRWSRRSSRSCG